MFLYIMGGDLFVVNSLLVGKCQQTFFSNPEVVFYQNCLKLMSSSIKYDTMFFESLTCSYLISSWLAQQHTRLRTYVSHDECIGHIGTVVDTVKQLVQKWASQKFNWKQSQGMSHTLEFAVFHFWGGSKFCQLMAVRLVHKDANTLDTMFTLYDQHIHSLPRSLVQNLANFTTPNSDFTHGVSCKPQACFCNYRKSSESMI